MIAPRIEVLIARIHALLPDAYIVRTDRLIEERSVALAVIERERSKPLRIQLASSGLATGGNVAYLRKHVADIDVHGLIESLQGLVHANPVGAWALREDLRPAREVVVGPSGVEGSAGLPRSAAGMLAEVFKRAPEAIAAIEIHEMQVLAGDQREIKRQIVTMRDAQGYAVASLPWTVAVTHALYRCNPSEGEEPEANTYRIECWAKQMNMHADAFVELLLALHTPVPMFGLTRLVRG